MLGWFSVMTRRRLGWLDVFDTHGADACCRDRNGARLMRLKRGWRHCGGAAARREVERRSGRRAWRFSRWPDQMGRDRCRGGSRAAVQVAPSPKSEATGDEGSGFPSPERSCTYYGLDDPAR